MRMPKTAVSPGPRVRAPRGPQGAMGEPQKRRVLVCPPPASCSSIPTWVSRWPSPPEARGQRGLGAQFLEVWTSPGQGDTGPESHRGLPGAQSWHDSGGKCPSGVPMPAVFSACSVSSVKACVLCVITRSVVSTLRPHRL